MAVPLFSNNASTTLASGISSGTTTILLATGTGAEFPSPAANQYFSLTLNDAATDQVYEICYCTARTGDSLTVTRGQEGTTARAWLLGDFAYGAVTAAELASFQPGHLLNIQTFAAAGTSTYTPTVGTNAVIVQVQGGGGAGGGTPGLTTGQNSMGGSGGSGAFGEGRYTSAFSGVTVTVGAAGVAAANTAGGNGGTSSFGALLSSPGGNGGALGAVNTTFPLHTVGGAATALPTGANVLSIAGSAATSSTNDAGASFIMGLGGGGPMGAGAINIIVGPGVAALNAGAGGSGAIANAVTSLNQAGGNGGVGRVIVYEYS